MVPTDPILSSVTAGAACSMILAGIQKSKIVPWVTGHTKNINLAIKLAMSGAATLGIVHAWQPSTTGGGTLMLTIPPLSSILVGLWHWFGQFAIQHGFGEIVFPGDKTPPPTS